MNFMAGWKYQRYCWLQTNVAEYDRARSSPPAGRSRGWRLLTIAVMIVMSALVVAGCTTEVQTSPPTESRGKARPPSLPQKCSHLYNVGRHHEWADCMGVGYR